MSRVPKPVAVIKIGIVTLRSDLLIGDDPFVVRLSGFAEATL